MVKAEGLRKVFFTPGGKVVALKDVSFRVKKGDLVAVCGPSGSGKTTLLSIIGGLTRPTSGVIMVNGVYLNSLSFAELSSFRLQNLGFAFQFSGLIPSLTLRENLTLPILLKEKGAADVSRIEKLTKELKLASRLNSYPSEISGGEARRAALIRALANSPPLLLADEPTGDLDEESARLIEKVIKEANRKGTTVIMVTHYKKLAQIANRILYLKNGVLQENK